MSRSQKPPTPDLSKTFWKPDFPKNRESVIREHPILRWGDYDITTDLYIWQKERFKGNVSSVYTSRMKKALAGIWYGVENDPRCDHCERADRSCTMAVTGTHGTTTCARCRIKPDRRCSFANFGRETTSSTKVCQRSTSHPSTHVTKHHKDAAGHQSDTRAIEDSDDEPLAKKRFKRSITHVREADAEHPPVKKHRHFGPRRRVVLHDDTDDEVPNETIIGPDLNHSAQAARLGVIEIPDSSPPSPLFCTPSTSPPAAAVVPTIPPSYQKGNRGFSHPVEAPSPADHFSPSTNAANDNQIPERIRVLEAEKRQDRARVLELEEYIGLLKEQQDRKLKLEIRELKRHMNYAINQTILQQEELGSDARE